MLAIYHVTTQAEWRSAYAAGVYQPESLSTEGYVHCCTEEFFVHVANFHFKNRQGLVLLEIDPEKLTADLRWEDVDGHKFPHVYGPITVDAVVREVDLVPNSDGLFEFPFKPVLH